MLAGDNVLVLYPRFSFNTRIRPSTSARILSQPRADNVHTTYACSEDLSLLRVAYFTARRICPYTAARTHRLAGAAVGIHHDFSAPSDAHSSQFLHSFGTFPALGTISAVGTSGGSLQHSPHTHQHGPPRAHPRGRAISASLQIPSRGKVRGCSRPNTRRQSLRLRVGKPLFMAAALESVPRLSVVLTRGRGPRVGVNSSASKEALIKPWKR
ncbi:hypothetical protein K525DRAFT_288468 [Schizophyllum commune Loenen D]|nr:hypothetical protein K525DRAFT_288468 [Schizophyllum commune Loenen D]